MRRAQEMAKRMRDYCVAHPGTRARIVTCYAGYKTEALESLVPAGTVHERDKFRFVFANGSVIDYAPIQKQTRESVTAAALEVAKKSGADYVRCRACVTNDLDTCQPLNGPDDMLCPCGKMREPYDCQRDEWMTA